MFYSPKLGCSICSYGLVAFVVAAGGKRLVLFCLQCGTWYPSIEHNANLELLDSTVAEGPDLQLVGFDCSVKFPPARWATAEEVRAYGWGDYLHPEPNRWLPDQTWSEAEWTARLRGMDVWEWDALQRKQPSRAEEPRVGLLDQFGRPLAESDTTAEQLRGRLLDPNGRPFAEPDPAAEQPRDPLLDQFGRPFAEPDAAPDRRRD